MTRNIREPDAEGATPGPNASIYYFAYGPIVNPMVRRRRHLNTSEERPAVLPEFRLTFAYGGIANIVHQRGYEVHGILMKFNSAKDWEDFQTYDAGYNDSDLVKVVPYDADEDDEPITAYAMTMKEYDASKLEAPIEQLPAERYLKLLAQGMQVYNVDEDYIQDQIMSVPYLPSCKPEDYQTFPQESDRLPKITFSKYEKLCKRSNDTYFILNNKVCRLGPHDPEHPAAMWVRQRLHGQTDSTLIIHKTIVEPDLPIVDTLEELTPQHHAWAENHSMEYLKKCNLTATKVYELVPEGKSTARGMKLWMSRCFGRKNETITTSPQPVERSGLRRSINLRAREEGLASSELLHREIRRHAGDGGDTDDNSSTQD